MFAKVAGSEIVYATVRFAPLQDAQARRARMGPVTGYYIIMRGNAFCEALARTLCEYQPLSQICSC